VCCSSGSAESASGLLADAETMVDHLRERAHEESARLEVAPRDLAAPPLLCEVGHNISKFLWRDVGCDTTRSAYSIGHAGWYI
jgi:hypothetical protein